MKLPTIEVKEINHAEAGASIRKLRVSKNISLRRLAASMGITPPYLSDMELGRRNWTTERFAVAQDKIKQIAK